jgi:predicted nuclease of predicted toxin-antitoxin system
VKALLDMPVTPRLLGVLEAHGHEGVHAVDLGMECSPDHALLERARREGRVVITADTDFSRLLALSMARGPGVILFRGGNYSDDEMCALLERVLDAVSAETMMHSICVVDQKRIRVRALPLSDDS